MGFQIRPSAMRSRGFTEGIPGRESSSHMRVHLNRHTSIADSDDDDDEDAVPVKFAGHYFAKIVTCWEARILILARSALRCVFGVTGGICRIGARIQT